MVPIRTKRHREACDETQMKIRVVGVWVGKGQREI